MADVKCGRVSKMSKRQIMAKIKSDIINAQHLFNILDESLVKERLEAQIGYMRNLYEYIEQEGKV